MKELWTLAVLGVREQPNLAQNLVTILVVTALNMFTLGIRRTCIILRHIRSWFEAVLALAIPQSCARGGPKKPFLGQKRVQMGPKWPKMVKNMLY